MQDLHVLAEKHILTGLREAGFVAGSIEEMLAKRIGALFMPHGENQEPSAPYSPSRAPWGTANDGSLPT